MCIKSRTHKGTGYNELRFDDATDNEEVFIHAQKDQNNVVEHDETTRVGNDRTENIGNDETISIGHDRKESVGNDETVSIGHDQSNTIGHNQNFKVIRNRISHVGKDEVIKIDNNRTLDVYADQYITTGGHHTHEVGGKLELKAGQKIIHLTEIHETMAGEKIIIRSAGGEIIIDGGGITLKGQVSIKGNLSIVSGSARYAFPPTSAKKGKEFDKLCGRKTDNTCEKTDCTCN